MLETPADLAFVIGGYNSSNTTHLVELCEERLPTYFINDEGNLLSREEILHHDFHSKQMKTTHGYLPEKEPLSVLITSGASCPDAIVEKVIRKLAASFGKEEELNSLISKFN
jgi:4-hydroxy-3-methylbut-2-enyl diphosphate reductase